MTTCLLALLALCHPSKAQIGLNVMASTASFVDAYATQRNFAIGHGVEYNPLGRPFETHGKVVAYASSAGESLALSFLAHKMKESHNWTRRIWWLPQVLDSVGHVIGAQQSFQNYH